ncbi:DNA gyrase subunit B [Parabacteroides sp. PF5-5]|uniref:DNA topoisomerase (ATP-hydrolyzing) subunit B n=1 Tax=unclassified Parabacteroides TaxID=2649774 RepID=UPI00247663A9|nr:MULTISPECIES: DNA topoisomerase (ATP-hydrolyzing) subunit B [unclassified Parabacteroides]MDH6303415.1 DNA gyrase subunit B [Parabacteroides sp. PH5-39]MDH6314738.1 DNA gyrase subunit B [Parabacteroides sp. PF5-13]MDH6318075.1 DNA gyrase subunit B [Parabacteroides sp. PH5-13]MDH6321994.1 DNA gyrase subunit B [Parabacteroides sp. PH5-8]MDH6326117.1 DNA gyrase subunit B [Parabacteroides sp. PH5-41]
MSEEIKNTNGDYSADSIQVLEGLEAVRKRPAMYIGDISEKGLHHLVYEVVDNSIDEALAGYCSNIDVTINEDNSITVVDDGRGIPVGMHEKEGKSALEVVLTVLHAGGKFDKGSYKVSGGLHGVGVSCVNALSTYLRAEVRREGKIYMQEFSCGHPTSELTVIGDSDTTGTTISFKPDDTIFIVTEYRYDILATRLRELAFLNAGVKLTLTDKRVTKEDGTFRTEVFMSDEGLKEFVRYIDRAKEKLIGDVIHIVTEKQGVPVEVAMTYNTSYNESVYSYVNDINTIEGGTHLAGFRRGLTRTLKKYAEDSKLLEKAKVEIQGDDFREGLTAVISIKVAEPQFEGQTKTKLGNSEVTGAVDQAVGEALGYFLEEHPKEAKIIVDKVILAAQARQAARKARELVQRKSPMSGGGLPGKLADCSSKVAEDCELFLVEGDSAGGTAKQGRDRTFQAILPLRGKILNVEKAMEHKIFDSEEIQNIFRAMGVTIGTEDDPKELNLSKLRYHKVIIMTDADVDGSHIATLILTFFFRRMRALIDNGYVYLATPPLYLCKKGKAEEYCWTEQQRQTFIDKYGGGSEAGIHTQRYKGLGEMNDHQLWDTTMNPENRTLKQITIESAAEADQIFSMLMGEEVAPRREFIEENATYANIDA